MIYSTCRALPANVHAQGPLRSWLWFSFRPRSVTGFLERCGCAIHAHEDRAAARQKAGMVAAKLREMKLADAAALMLAAARLRHVAGSKWGTRRYLDMNRLARAGENFRLPLGGAEHHNQTDASTKV